MQLIRQLRMFDDRAVDFLSGKKVSPPRNTWKICACCGLRIIKGYEMSNGDKVGEDCAVIIARAYLDTRYIATANITEFEALCKRTGFGTLKPAISRYINENIFEVTA
ncbi:hypothetical protein GXB81_01820 [Paraburkholderia sp. Ac-20336]|uniref:hypothetical protein n=1 Tax=unclassified Paraburkholderia TaxID=2615204 RepID=UPI001423B1A9|nr:MULTISPECIES: hypothetical protein [unclassified Paraburkholderia]MBN3801801.1 hypothetical protein [Paraburkholderia sp. Ac-20336]MBN3845543.1 hypothetical protein [Paraburkholderia sp. Ac-20342]NIF75817.1 hypothetical protein [Paraburkholderia sp. Cy-641]